MDQAGQQIFVRSHVARDLLQSAALFASDRHVIWEYVSNGLQCIEPGVTPVVEVKIEQRPKRIVIRDNGRGMDWDGLQNFFIMHGENIDRKAGKRGRGYFGTGKSAAFGIADLLRITTVRNGRRSSVELNRADVQKMRSGDPISVDVVERDTAVAESNGTIVEIEKIHLRSIDVRGVIQFIDRHLTRWPRSVRVYVDGHECEPYSQPAAWEQVFQPDDKMREKLGDVELVVKVMKSPLEEDLRGVSIYSSGVWHETTLAGNENREMSQYISGEIDVPRLDEDESPIPPFDQSRSLRLNPNNQLVQTLYAFIGQKVDEVRRRLVEEERRQKATVEARRLAHQASEIARVLNDDFSDFRRKVPKVQSAATGGPSRQEADGAELTGPDLIFGNLLPAEVMQSPVADDAQESTAQNGAGSGTTEPTAPDVRPADSGAPLLGQLAGDSAGRRKATGGFQVKFQNIGEDQNRARYVSEERTIYINLDHPQIAAALHNGTADDPIFRRLCYEVALTEYSIALAQELAHQGRYMDPSEALTDIRDTVNRIARKAADLYA